MTLQQKIDILITNLAQRYTGTWKYKLLKNGSIVRFYRTYEKVTDYIDVGDNIVKAIRTTDPDKLGPLCKAIVRGSIGL